MVRHLTDPLTPTWQLRGLLQQQERRRDDAEDELAQLQAALQETVYEQELMREQRGAPEDQGQAAAAAAAGGRGVTMLDSPTYSSMLPEEQVELSLFRYITVTLPLHYRYRWSLASSASASHTPSHQTSWKRPPELNDRGAGPARRVAWWGGALFHLALSSGDLAAHQRILRQHVSGPGQCW